jgi:hypothetical protein
MCRLRERAAGGEKIGRGGAVPIGKVGDEVEQGLAQFDRIIECGVVPSS